MCAPREWFYAGRKEDIEMCAVPAFALHGNRGSRRIGLPSSNLVIKSARLIDTRDGALLRAFHEGYMLITIRATSRESAAG